MPVRVAPPTIAETVRLPVPALLVMTLSGFALVTTETMPAGLLPQIAAGMHTSEGTAGQYISAFALGAIVFAVPAATLTRGLRRKPVYLFGLVGFLVMNTVTTFSANLLLALGTRVVTGAFAGLLWAMMAGYARSISPPDQAGRALSIASTGVPIGLATGTPIGSWLGGEAGWRWAFGAMSVLFAIVSVLAVAVVRDAPGQRATSHLRVRQLIMLPGVRRILAVILFWMTAHNLLYTYLAPYLRSTHIGLGVDPGLVIVGASAIAGRRDRPADRPCAAAPRLGPAPPRSSPPARCWLWPTPRYSSSWRHWHCGAWRTVARRPRSRPRCRTRWERTPTSGTHSSGPRGTSPSSPAVSPAPWSSTRWALCSYR